MTNYHNIRPAKGEHSPDAISTAVMNSESALLYYWDSAPRVFGNYANNNFGHFFCSNILAFAVDNLDIQSGIVLKKASPFRENFNQV